MGWALLGSEHVGEHLPGQQTLGYQRQDDVRPLAEKVVRPTALGPVLQLLVDGEAVEYASAMKFRRNQLRIAMLALVMVASAAPAQAKTSTTAITGRFLAVSKTASSIIGDVSIVPGRIIGSLGIRLSTKRAGTVSTKASAGRDNGSFGDLLNITGTRQLQVLAVTSERVTKAAPNGGACNPKRTSYVVLGLSTDRSKLSMATFSGTGVPGSAGGKSALCGTFLFEKP